MNKTNKKKRIVILGVTGSIGTQALKCLDGLELVGISFYKNLNKAKEILAQFEGIDVYSSLETSLNTVENLDTLLMKTKPDLVLNAMVGWSGLEATLLCLKHNFNLALANKESLVIAGWYIIEQIKQKNNYLFYPVDSEHSSLYELMQIDKTNVNAIYLTASGGPFYRLDETEKAKKSFQETIKHPKWNMGYKISVDSATMVNKCFELIEAHYLFPEVKEIYALYHPQAIVHALIRFNNNSYLANFSNPDMRLHIDLALHDFQRLPNTLRHLDFSNINLTFQTINPQVWKPIGWAQEVITTNNKAMGVIINTVNDFAIEAFKNNKISFLEITSMIEAYLIKYKSYKITSLNDLFELHDIIKSDLLKKGI